MAYLPPSKIEQKKCLPTWPPDKLAEFFEDAPLIITRVAIALRVRRHLIEDVVQETILRVLENGGKYDAERDLWAWVNGIARRVIFGFYRDAKRTGPLDVDPEGKDEFEIVWCRELLEIVKKRVAGKEGLEAEVGKLRLIDGMPTEDLMVRFNIPASYVYNAARRLRESLADLTQDLED